MSRRPDLTKKLPVLTFLLSLAIFGSIIPGLVIPRAHASGSGLVCIAQVTDTNCPVGLGPTFNGPVTTPQSLLRVPVMINNTDPFLGFDITLNSSDVSKLKPYGVDLSGSIMPAGSIILAECIGGKLILGSTCAPTDSPTTVHIAIVGPFGFLTSPGTTGLLFTAIFGITGNTPPGGININFQNKCSNTSSGTLCATVTNGTTTPVPEATRTGSFDNSDTTMLPYATLTTSRTNLGISLPGAPTHPIPITTYTATSQNNFNTSSTPQLTLATSVNGTGTRPTVSLTTSLLDLTGVTRAKFNQTGSVSSTVPVGIYIATVTATYQTQDLITFTTSSLSATYSLPINVTGFKLSATSPGSQTAGTAEPSTITVTFYKFFTATVAFTNNTVPNLSCLTISPASFTTNG